MSELYQIYKCGICGNVFEVLHAGTGVPVCCGANAELMMEKTEEVGLTEKHLPLVEKEDGKTKIKVGEIPHPMIDVHYIEWIELIIDGKMYKKFLHPGDTPEAEFEISGEDVIARAFCNIHGLWRTGGWPKEV